MALSDRPLLSGRRGAFYQPTGGGRWAAIDPADIGAAAVKALTEPGHEHQAYTLTGPESLSAAQYAVKLSVAIGKPVKFVDVPPEASRQGMLQSGMPTVLVDALMELLAVTKAGKPDTISAVRVMHDRWSVGENSELIRRADSVHLAISTLVRKYSSNLLSLVIHPGRSIPAGSSGE